MRIAPRVSSAVVLVGLIFLQPGSNAAQTAATPAPQATRTPLLRAIDINAGETTQVELCDGKTATVTLHRLDETHDTVCFAVRRAIVTVEVNGRMVTLTSGNYHLPATVGGVRIDCPVTKGCNENGAPAFWGLDKDVRLRLWPADSPLQSPDSFIYPVKQKWFATNTQMANEPVFVDGGDRSGRRSIYYHSGLDIGGAEGLVEVIAATDGLVVSVGDKVLEGHGRETPVSPRYDVVYLMDAQGWYYRYSHLKTIDPQIVPGRVVQKGDAIGLLGKEGGSGGWSHLHFEIKSRQPSGKWGTQEGYAFLWEAYQQQYQPSLIAVARPHHLIWVGDSVSLDATKSWTAAGEIVDYHWQFSDGTTGSGSRIDRTYDRPGRYSEVLRITNSAGETAWDFAIVQVADRQHPDRPVPSIHPAFYPTSGIRPGTDVTFRVRTFNTTHGQETWDFGDGTGPVTSQSDGNAVKLAPDGYAHLTHRFAKPGNYIVQVQRSDAFGVTATGHVWVSVESDASAAVSSTPKPSSPWQQIAPFFSPPDEWKDNDGNYRSPLLFADGRRVQSAADWQQRRQEILTTWNGLLGEWPPLITEPQVEILESQRRENFQQLRIRFRWTPQEFTTAWLLIPDGTQPRPAAVTVYYEPDTAIGNGGAHRDFALQLARRGFVTLSIGTTEASQAKTFGLYYPDLQNATVQPLSMLACAAANAWYVLAARPEVDAQRIGIVGHSFGGKWAMFASCLFDKYACAAWSDPGIVFDEDRGSVNYWEPWYLGYHPQPWRERGLITPQNPARGLYPRLVEQGFDLHELHALMAPRPFLVSGGSEDPPRRWAALNHSIAVNRLLGYSDRVGMTNRPEHSPNEDSNAQIYAFFEHFLKAAPDSR